jgi:hypothetical protein
MRAAQDPRSLQLQRQTHRNLLLATWPLCFLASLLTTCLGLFQI